VELLGHHFMNAGKVCIVYHAPWPFLHFVQFVRGSKEQDWYGRALVVRPVHDRGGNDFEEGPLGKISSPQTVHRRPSANIALRPGALGAEFVTAGILKPGDMASLGIDIEHKGAIVVRQDDVGEAISGNVLGDDSDRRVKGADGMAGPC